MASALVQDFLKDGFVVSEAPGKEGRGLRDAGIRLLKYVSITGSKPRHFYVRVFFTWAFNK